MPIFACREQKYILILHSKIYRSYTCPPGGRQAGLSWLPAYLAVTAGREHLTLNIEEMIVYVLQSEKDGRLYVGMTMDVDKRVAAHNAGRTKSTKGYRPWKLIHFEEYPDRLTARKREIYLKSGFGKQWLKNKYK